MLTATTGPSSRSRSRSTGRLSTTPPSISSRPLSVGIGGKSTGSRNDARMPSRRGPRRCTWRVRLIRSVLTSDSWRDSPSIAASPVTRSIGRAHADAAGERVLRDRPVVERVARDELRERALLQLGAVAAHRVDAGDRRPDARAGDPVDGVPRLLELAQHTDVRERPCAAAGEHQPEAAAGQPVRDVGHGRPRVAVDHRQPPGVRARPPRPPGPRGAGPPRSPPGPAAGRARDGVRHPAACPRHQDDGVRLPQAEVPPGGVCSPRATPSATSTTRSPASSALARPSASTTPGSTTVRWVASRSFRCWATSSTAAARVQADDGDDMGPGGRSAARARPGGAHLARHLGQDRPGRPWVPVEQRVEGRARHLDQARVPAGTDPRRPRLTGEQRQLAHDRPRCQRPEQPVALDDLQAAAAQQVRRPGGSPSRTSHSPASRSSRPLASARATRASSESAATSGMSSRPIDEAGPGAVRA